MPSFLDLLQAIVLGIVQGLTEFLPVSSSGHIELVKAIFGSDPSRTGLMMTIILHAATALSTIVIYRKDVFQILKDVFTFKKTEYSMLALKIVVSMIPAAFVGLMFKDEMEVVFTGNILLVGMMLLVTGVLLFVADKASKSSLGVSFPRALIIGISQAIAILPGVSRSGATISTSVLMKVDREKAARFSFLMVVPLILGAAVLDVKKFTEITHAEKLNLEERVAYMMHDVEEDFSIQESEQIRLSLIDKEMKWDALKITGTNDVSLIEADFENDMISILGEDNFEEITKSELLGVRNVNSVTGLELVIGFVMAFISGLLACKWMIGIVKNSKLKYFAYYCFTVGVLAIIFSF